MTLNEDLIEQVDSFCERRGTTRSAFTRAALARELRYQEILEQESLHRESYQKDPEGEELILPGQIWPEFDQK